MGSVVRLAGLATNIQTPSKNTFRVKGPQTGYFQQKLNFSNDLYKTVLSLYYLEISERVQKNTFHQLNRL